MLTRPSNVNYCCLLAFLLTHWLGPFFFPQVSSFGGKISLIMISEFYLWFGPLIQDQFQDSPLSVLWCHEACKALRTCTKCDYMMWQWGVVSKCSPPALKFNWIGLLPIQLNFISKATPVKDHASMQCSNDFHQFNSLLNSINCDPKLTKLWKSSHPEQKCI